MDISWRDLGRRVGGRSLLGQGLNLAVGLAQGGHDYRVDQEEARQRDREKAFKLAVAAGERRREDRLREEEWARKAEETESARRFATETERQRQDFEARQRQLDRDAAEKRAKAAVEAKPPPKPPSQAELDRQADAEWRAMKAEYDATADTAPGTDEDLANRLAMSPSKAAQRWREAQARIAAGQARWQDQMALARERLAIAKAANDRANRLAAIAEERLRNATTPDERKAAAAARRDAQKATAAARADERRHARWWNVLEELQDDFDPWVLEHQGRPITDEERYGEAAKRYHRRTGEDPPVPFSDFAPGASDTAAPGATGAATPPPDLTPTVPATTTPITAMPLTRAAPPITATPPVLAAPPIAATPRAPAAPPITAAPTVSAATTPRATATPGVPPLDRKLTDEFSKYLSGLDDDALWAAIALLRERRNDYRRRGVDVEGILADYDENAVEGR